MSFTFGAPGLVNVIVWGDEIQPVDTNVTDKVYVPAAKLEMVT
jgi:hypothetical protein